MTDLILHLFKDQKAFEIFNTFISKCEKKNIYGMYGLKQVEFMNSLKDDLHEYYEVLEYLIKQNSLLHVLDCTKKSVKIKNFSDKSKVKIYSTSKISESKKNSIKEDLKQNIFSDKSSFFYTKESVSFDFKVDETLISGILIKIGDYIFDNSLKTKIRRGI